jgi:beta-glucanase (GH16 family)
MFRIRSLIIVLICLAMSQSTVFGTELSPDINQQVDKPAYLTSTGWSISGLGGHQFDRDTYWTGTIGTTATWIPAFDSSVRSQIWFYKVSRSSDPNLQIEILHNKKSDVVFIDCSDGNAGWVNLGVYDFAGKGEEYVKLTKNSKGGSLARISAVKFDILGEDNSTVVRSFILDEITGGPLKWEPSNISFDDIKNHKERFMIERLALRGIVSGVTNTEFKPDDYISYGEYCSWVLRAIERIGATDNFRLSKPSTPTERAMALSKSVVQGLVSKEMQADTELNCSALLDMMNKSVEFSKRNMEWAGSEKIDWHLKADKNIKVTRAQASEVLWLFFQTIVEAGPPNKKSWKLTFQDEFNEKKLDVNKWSVEAGSPGHIQSSRWPENVDVNNGLLRLLTKKENRGGKAWTTGNIWTEQFRQQYGYFEARLKIGKATGLNNAFWLSTNKDEIKKYTFEIDVTEARYPNRNSITLHQAFGKSRASNLLWLAPENLSEDFHVYGLEWTDKEIVWYFDGQEIKRMEHESCHEKTPIRLSSAVGGGITNALDGTVMEVDWVRVYEKSVNK